MKITPSSILLEFFILLLVYLAVLTVILQPIYINSGIIVYPLDDVYIHLKIASNVFMNGIWGIDSSVPISASTSPFYTLLLSTFFISTENAIFAPLILNIIASIIIIYQIVILTNVTKLTRFCKLCIGITFILVIPLPSLTVLGMEHLIHCMLVLSIILFFRKESRSKVVLFILFALALFIRLETVFLVLGVGIWCIFEKKWNTLLLTSIGFILGLCLYVVLSLLFSIEIIPNTILLKTVISDQSIFNSTLVKIWNSKLLLFLSILSFSITIYKWNKSKLFLIPFVTLLLHLVFARQGWFYRYEAYCIAIVAVFIIIEFLQDPISVKKVSTIFILLVFILITSKRAFLSLSTTHIASKNIYDQQIQMAMLVKTLPTNANIAVNDIGAVSYYNENSFLDLYGIASPEVFSLKKSNKYNSKNIDSLLLVKNIDFLLIYTSWFNDTIFSDFKQIGSIHLTNNVVCGDTTVAIFQRATSTKKLTLPLP